MILHEKQITYYIGDVMKPVRSFLLYDKNISKNSYTWNMLGCLLHAFQSTIMLIVLKRTVGLAAAGIFNIAYTNASLFYKMGHYGMRNYQVSDVKRKYSFKDYHLTRLITVFAMMLFGTAYIFYAAATKNYSSYKMNVMIWMLLFNAVDAYESVYHGAYQQNNRLDVAGRCMTIRMTLLIIAYVISIIITKDQLISLIITTVSTFVVFIIFTLWTKHLTKPIAVISETAENVDTKSVTTKSVTTESVTTEKHAKNAADKLSKNVDNNAAADATPVSTSKWKRVSALLVHCFPLFAGTFLAFYIANAPKYAIDSTLSNDIQGYYGIITQPIYVIYMLNDFIFMPQIYPLSKLWDEGRIDKFVKKSLKQVFILILLTLVCLVGAYFLGIPVLSVVFNSNLKPFKTSLMILMIGAGFLGMTGFLSSVITIIRCQKYTMYGYIIVALVALLFSNRVVKKYEILGASIFYTSLMALLTVIFLIILIVGVKKKTTKK